MDRQTLDMEGARRGEITPASLQLGDDTIAIQRIATMSVESMEFAPWDTETNRRTKSLYASFFVISLFFGLLALAWGGLFPGSGSSMIALIVGCVLTLLAVILGVRAAMFARRMKKRQPYYRLVIGASDGRQIPLVDDNRAVLLRIRDIVRHKMDSGDREVQGDFDLDLDLVNISKPNETRELTSEVTSSEEVGGSSKAEAEVLFDEPSGDLRSVT